MTVTKQPATSTLELTDKLEASLQDLQKNLPADVKGLHGHFPPEPLYRKLHRQRKEVLVRRRYLRGHRTFPVPCQMYAQRVISLVTLPLSLLVSILTLHYMGLTINTMSLGGIAIAIGSLVDDAIVDVENVYKRLRENQSETRRRTTFHARSGIQRFQGSAYADSELDTDHRGQFRAAILPFRNGRTYAGSAGYRLHRGTVCLNGSGIDLDPGTCARYLLGQQARRDKKLKEAIRMPAG